VVSLDTKRKLFAIDRKKNLLLHPAASIASLIIIFVSFFAGIETAFVV